MPKLRRQTEFWEAAIKPVEGDDLTGRAWDVTVIGPATASDLVKHNGKEYVKSKNGRLYSVEALRESTPRWDGVKVYDNHLSDDEFEERAGMRSVAGEWIGNIVKPRWDEAARAIKGIFKVVDKALASKLKEAWGADVLKSIGLSIDTVPEGREAVIEGKRTPIIEGFKDIVSVDLVAEPAAGGALNRILAAKQTNGGSDMAEVTEELVKGWVSSAVEEALKSQGTEEVDAEEAGQAVVDAAEEVVAAAPVDADPAAVAQAAADAAQATADEIVEEGGEETPAAVEALAKAKEFKGGLAALEARVAEIIKKKKEALASDSDDKTGELATQVRQMECKLMLRDKLADAALPAEMAQIVESAFAGKTFEEAEVDTMVKRTKEAHIALDPTGRVRGAGGSRIAVGQSGIDKAGAEFLRLVAGNRAFREIEGNEKHYVQERVPESYKAWIKGGRANLGYRRVSELVYDLLGGDPFSSQRAAESLTQSNMSSIVKNALNVMLAMSYSKRTEWWAPIVTEEEVDTLDQATLVRTYGMDTLSVVNEGNAYTELAWRDDEETADFVKKGNYVGVTLETLLNDKLNEIRRIPDRLATSWYNTLSAMVSAVFTTNTAAGPVLADTGALFNATAVTTGGGHANLLTTALSHSQFGVIRTAMRKQTDQYSGGGTAKGTRLLMDPKFVLIPVDLEDTAERIRMGEFVPGSADYDRNIYQDKFENIIVPEWTDVNNYAMVSDPSEFPAIFLIFLRGKRVPELFTADSDVAGAMFTNDTLRYKVRLMTWRYSSTYDCAPVADFRPLHKSNVA